MTNAIPPALDAEQWAARDYRQSASAIDAWTKQQPAADDDATEYVAKLGVNDRDCVIVMNRAHDRVLVPPPARAPLAALALAGQPFGFTRDDAAAVRRAADAVGEDEAATLRRIAARLDALAPPERA